MLHKVRDLSVDARGIVESLIGRSLREDETFSIRPIHLQKEGADARLAGEVADRLERHFSEVDQQHADISDADADAALDAAMRSVRPGYTPHV